MTDLFGKGIWLRVNLHTHTTVSDGAYTPEAACKLYADAGYDVLALTDHWKQSQPVVCGSMFTLSGCEWDVAPTSGCAETIHIVGVGMKEKVELERKGLTAQMVVDAINAADGAAIFAHPAWSVSTPGVLTELTGFVGSEVWNSASAFPFTGRPDSTIFFDQCAQQGDFLPMMAADDSHWYQSDALCGWTWVLAKERSREGVLEALRAGHFYASTGPRITRLCRDGDALYIECDRKCTIGVLSNAPWMGGRCVVGEKMEYQLKEYEKWFRIECVDEKGGRAWCGVFRV